MLEKTDRYDYIVICHLFYPEEVMNLLDKLKALKKYKTLFVFNLGNFFNPAVVEMIKQEFNKALIYINPPKGRDIGAKLFLINAVFNINVSSKYVLIVHDKKSPHLGNGVQWRNELLKVISPLCLTKMDHYFQDDKVGIVASASFIQNEFNFQTKKFNSNSNQILKGLISKLCLNFSDFNFIAGSIYVIRFDILKSFFEKPETDLLEIIKDLEEGNELDFSKGTYIHSWERMLSWIATSQGYSIYGI